MLDLQVISDRLELQDLAHAYARAIDTRDFDALGTHIFAPDATIDYGSVGGPVGILADLLAWIRPGLTALGPSHHLMANHHFVIEGDTATGRIMCYNPMWTSVDDKARRDVIVHGLFYIDRYVRGPAGWRIASRRAEGTYQFATVGDPHPVEIEHAGR